MPAPLLVHMWETMTWGNFDTHEVVWNDGTYLDCF